MHTIDENRKHVHQYTLCVCVYVCAHILYVCCTCATYLCVSHLHFDPTHPTKMAEMAGPLKRIIETNSCEEQHSFLTPDDCKNKAFCFYLFSLNVGVASKPFKASRLKAETKQLEINESCCLLVLLRCTLFRGTHI